MLSYIGSIKNGTILIFLQQADPTLDSLSDEELIGRLQTFDFQANALDPLVDLFGGQSPIWRFTPDTVVKAVIAETTHEPYTMAMVSSQTSIPVPQVRRYVYWSSRLWIFMEYIAGDDLESAWRSLSLWNKLWVAWTLHRYVQQLRRVSLANCDIPGPIDGSGRPLLCSGHYFTDNGAGPFTSYSQMSSWFASKSRITALLMRQRDPNHQEPYATSSLSFDDSMPLVLTYGDISLRNVRLGSELSGFLTGSFPALTLSGLNTPGSWHTMRESAHPECGCG